LYFADAYLNPKKDGRYLNVPESIIWWIGHGVKSLSEIVYDLDYSPQQYFVRAGFAIGRELKTILETLHDKKVILLIQLLRASKYWRELNQIIDLDQWKVLDRAVEENKITILEAMTFPESKLLANPQILKDLYVPREFILVFISMPLVFDFSTVTFFNAIFLLHWEVDPAIIERLPKNMSEIVFPVRNNIVLM
jgi:hypothetical protein